MVENNKDQFTVSVAGNYNHTLSGIRSSIAWNDPELCAALNKMFKIKPNEIITNIQITSSGLIASIDFRKSST